jgi:hypothetical protein
MQAGQSRVQSFQHSAGFSPGTFGGFHPASFAAEDFMEVVAVVAEGDSDIIIIELNSTNK